MCKSPVLQIVLRYSPICCPLSKCECRRGFHNRRNPRLYPPKSNDARFRLIRPCYSIRNQPFRPAIRHDARLPALPIHKAAKAQKYRLRTVSPFSQCSMSKLALALNLRQNPPNASSQGAQDAIAKPTNTTCPWGWISSGSYCLAGRQQPLGLGPCI